MKYSTTRFKHPKWGFWYAYMALKLKEIFKNRGWVDMDRFNRKYDYGVYLVIIDSDKPEDWVQLSYMELPIKGKLIYVGRGVIDINNLALARAINHIEDMLSRAIKDNDKVCVYMLGCGMTYDESSALEAFWIDEARIKYGLKLSKVGQYNWDGVSLINKKPEKAWLEKSKDILKPYGNNTRSTT